MLDEGSLAALCLREEPSLPKAASHVAG
jgi:hypothetical protein